ncbi:MAG: bifunctional (p)ppGpp synthetase/guanosine-3',5'-bis(diphosphate) 3'-pyrophosphohydrolase [Candidatus Marinimicrobia bacterium]|jgi:GTP pyrophosphokinase|nr:bifunctional (p)ppGpp synthetase/guanosine-3',5'-bis(diphosphate) 3'-pyrophosphohydrolase [Candidatus Neomarinimicrobiota bacterium]MDP6789576.1 bifunctional (p)ppGpp synthetase/guanosine-3',5'-bis(diphosphate) 3'-pyrophosphohydrolase [Candidatus Neomarinimicrobiota bacterium]MDP7071844.1 bifunctional (p)ppGpp synthetase/guanosine-3',5'-bis(diphosphate) 3'-pyrophosphohydrolase [Candidatus Neomarinimicrobiota bacterium]
MQNPLARFVPKLAGEYPKSFLKLYDQVSVPNGMDPEDVKEILWKAYEYGDRHHEGQKRKSGAPYFEHCIAVAEILASWNMDPTMIMGGLLHDTVEDTKASHDDLAENFGEDVAVLVEGVTKLGDIEFSTRQEQQAGNFMKMLLSVAKDIRVIIIKFADRLHNMRTIEYIPRIKQHRIAIETRDVYSPLAHRLGMAKVKWQLDDLVFKTLNPKAYKEIDSKLKSTTKERERYIKKVTTALNKELSAYDLKADVYGRPKSHHSIYKKMISQDKTFDEIYDKEAIRVIVDKMEDCYLTLGVIHQNYNPVQERFKDFIATPKSNAYQSIHTTVVGPEKQLVEIQIRTADMEATAEIGVAAHWRYKEGKGSDTKEIDSQVGWLRELLEILRSEESDPREFMHLLKIDLFSDEIFVFTPKGALVQLPVSSTPIDFAFKVHTEVGMKCLGAKVNHVVVPLNTELKNGDLVEIITGKNQNPNYGWLKFVVTSKARNKINRFLKQSNIEASLKLGEEILVKTLRRLKKLGLKKEIKSSFQKFGFQNEDQLLEAIGNGSLTVRKIFEKIAPDTNPEFDLKEEKPSRFSFTGKGKKSVQLQGIKDVMVSFGKCCNPIPGDEMLGFITRGRGLTVHRSTCSSLPLLNEQKDRLVPVDWDVAKTDLFNVRLKITGQDRKGILKDLTESISSQNINIKSVDMRGKDSVATAHFIVQVNNIRQLDRIIRKIKKVNGVDHIERAER